MANSYHQGFPGESHGKESACNAGDLGLILELGRSPRGGHGNPFQHSCLENLHGHRSLAGYSPPSLKELDMTERLSIAQLSSTSDRQMIPLMAESEEELKSLLMKVKEESEKAGLKLNIQKMKTMASGLITSWQIDVETGTVFIFLGSRITADGDCSHEIKRRLILGRKAMTNLHSVLKSRDITLPTKVCLVKAMVFPVVMYICESWAIKRLSTE